MKRRRKLKELENRILKEVKLHSQLMAKIPDKYESAEKKRHLKALNSIAEDFAYKTNIAYTNVLENHKPSTVEEARYFQAIDNIIAREKLYEEVAEHKDLKHNFKQQGVELERSR